MANDLPIIMLSGMATDERLFESQLAAFPSLRIQPWIMPQPKESLRDYARRLALKCNPGKPCLIGGASFGGVVALEMAMHMPARACLLIGSMRSPTGIPRHWRLLRPFGRLGPDVLQIIAALGARIGGRFLGRGTLRKLKRLSRAEARFIRWAMCAVMKWQPSPGIRLLRVFHIHGSADHVFPVSLARPDAVVMGGAHALCLSHPSAVNKFIAEVLQGVTQ